MRNYRRAILADPHATDAELARTATAAPSAAAYTERLMRFEGGSSVRCACSTGPDGRAGGGGRRAMRPAARPRARSRSWLALAASVLVGAGDRRGRSGSACRTRSLAADVVAHMAGEPQAWTRTDVPVPAPELDFVLRNTHMRLQPDAGVVSYAQSCAFRGHQVPHLVVQTDMGPVTVMVLVHEPRLQAEAVR